MIALDPNETYRYSHEVYAGRPEDERPTFIVRYMTARERSAYAAGLDKIIDIGTASPAGIEAAVATLAVPLCGWENITATNGDPVPFDPDKLPDVLTDEELADLLWGVLRGAQLSIEAKKKSGSLASSQATPPTAAASVESADAVATTSP